MSRKCEACESNEAEVVEPRDNPQTPYHVCSLCHQRLRALALRPLEWYNLAKRYGWHQYLLHDDFYDEDGTASQPQEDVGRPEDFPIPSLASVCQEPELLLDYSITRWHVKDDVASAWKAMQPSTVLPYLSRRFAATTDVIIRSRLLTISALALGDYGATFVRYAWGEYPERASLASLAEASAACLPYREGIDRVITSLNQLADREKRDSMFALGYFHTQEALDWLEQNIFEPITESWGYLAAASKIDWPRVTRWLDQGRPLSLVAIDALCSIVRPMSPFLRTYRPSLVQPPDAARFREVLSAYCRRDPAPRVQKRVGALLANAEALTRKGQD
jgi:hypothetical protein